MSLRLSLSFALNSERSGRKRTKTRTLLPFLNGAIITDRTMEHRCIQRWKDIMAACFKSGAKDATGTKVANHILSSIPRGLGNTGSPEKKCWLVDCASIILSLIQQSEHYFKLLFQFSTAGIIRAFMR